MCGYLAIWPAMYSLGVYALAELVATDSIQLQTKPVLYILLCAHACYLFDRVKITDRRQDPADAIALPTRSLLFSRHALAIRTLIGIELAIAIIIGLKVHPLLSIIPLLAMIVVHVYAGRGATPNAPRLKDLPALKAFIIASAHIALVIMVLTGNSQIEASELLSTHLFGMLGIWFIVAGDAVLCDIDDVESDSIYRTQSLAVILGTYPAWVAALGFLILGAFCISFGSHPKNQSIAIGVTIVLTTMLTRKNTNHRDFVDLRLLPSVLGWVWLY